MSQYRVNHCANFEQKTENQIKKRHYFDIITSTGDLNGTATN